MFCLAAILPLATSAAARAPQSADLWRVRVGVGVGVATAGRAPSALGAGAQVLHTPDAVGLTGILGGLGYSIVGAVIAR